MSELATIAFFVTTGWFALWPARRSLGPLAFHFAALPTGLMAAPIAGSISTVTGRPLDLISAAAGAFVLAAVMQVVLRWLPDRTGRAANVSAASFGITAAAIGGISAVLAVLRITVTNNDSVMSYWPLGVELARKGDFTVSLLGARSALIPTMHAVHVDFGSQWAYVVYPLMAATVLGWLWLTLAAGPLRGLGRRISIGVGLVAVAALAIEPSFLFHAFFVHSDLVSGLYLFLAIMSLGVSVRRDPDGTPVVEDDSPAPLDRSFLVLAGLFTAGLALGRPDGLAYMFVPVAVAIAVITRTRFGGRDVASFFAPLGFVMASVYGASFATLGLWQSGKLGGKTTLAILVLLAASAAAPWIVRALARALPFEVAGDRFLSLLVSISALLMVVAWAVKWDTASEALQNAWINLFQGSGGYNYLWWAIAALLVLSVFTGDALRRGSWTRSPFLALMLFFVIAGLVHGLSHEGRIGVGDSFNRIAFHAVPLAFWYAAAIVSRVVRAAEPEIPAA